MKKIYSLLATMAMSIVFISNASAQSKRLIEIASDGEMNRAFIHYNENNLADSIYQKEFNPNGYTTETYRLIEYDENGRISLEKKFICNDEINYFLADSVMITYDDKGRIDRRLWYNRDESYKELDIKGDIQYIYDDNNKLIEEYNYYGEDTKYTYDENGVLLHKESSSEKTEYTYDNEGRMISKLYYKKDEPNKRTDYKYDKNENLIQRAITDVKENVVLQKLYIKHDMSLPASLVQFPFSEIPVDNYYSLCENELYLLSKNAINTIDVYSMHWWEGGLGKDHKATFVYEDHIGAGIDAAQTSDAAANIVVENGKIIVSGITSPTTVSVYDITGKMVYSKHCADSTVIDNLASGTYVIKVSGGSKIIIL